MKFLIQVLIEIILIVLLFLGIIKNDSLDLILVLFYLLINLVTLALINKRKTIKSIKEKEYIITVIISCLIMMVVFYLIGIKNGYEINLSVMYKRYLDYRRWGLSIIIVLLTELVRYILLSIDNTKRRKNILMILGTVIFVLVDTVISINPYNFNGFNNSFLTIALIVLPSISKNILLNYFCGKYGYKPCMIYRIIMDLYIFYLPVTPIINNFVKSVLYIMYPYFLYKVLDKYEEDDDLEEVRVKKNIFLDILTYGAAIMFIALITGEFKYSIIAIGSDSMKGYFSKGDAVIYQKYNDEELNEGDVLVFSKNNTTIVHRVVEKYKLYDEYYYLTKGDANEEKDNWIVENKDIVGIVKFKIKYIGWPTVLISEN